MCWPLEPESKSELEPLLSDILADLRLRFLFLARGGREYSWLGESRGGDQAQRSLRAWR